MKHDENKDLKSVARIAKINPGDKSIQCSKNATIGIHMWGKIDYLTKYCGWHFIWNNSIGGVNYTSSTESSKSIRDLKKAKKQPKLTDKTKKNKK